jgi:hypothetical protein
MNRQSCLRRNDGAGGIEACPRDQPRASDAGHIRGPRSMCDARGFLPVNEELYVAGSGAGGTSLITNLATSAAAPPPDNP